MKHSVLVFGLILYALSVNGQVKQEVIASAGGYDVNGGISVSWTLGETIIPVFKNSNLSLTHGFQQQIIITAIEKNIDVPVELSLFPNPASDVLNIKFESPLDSKLDITILDSQGRLVRIDVIEAALEEKQINLQDLSPGVYYLRLAKGRLVNVYKVVKL